MKRILKENRYKKTYAGLVGGGFAGALTGHPIGVAVMAGAGGIMGKSQDDYDVDIDHAAREAFPVGTKNVKIPRTFGKKGTVIGHTKTKHIFLGNNGKKYKRDSYKVWFHNNSEDEKVNKIVELYAPHTPDEHAFINMHIVQKTDYVPGYPKQNDLYTAKSIPAYTRSHSDGHERFTKIPGENFAKPGQTKNTRYKIDHGYMPGEDATVYFPHNSKYMNEGNIDYQKKYPVHSRVTVPIFHGGNGSNRTNGHSWFNGNVVKHHKNNITTVRLDNGSKFKVRTSDMEALIDDPPNSINENKDKNNPTQPVPIGNILNEKYGDIYHIYQHHGGNKYVFVGSHYSPKESRLKANELTQKTGIAHIVVPGPRGKKVVAENKEKINDKKYYDNMMKTSKIFANLPQLSNNLSSKLSKKMVNKGTQLDLKTPEHNTDKFKLNTDKFKLKEDLTPEAKAKGWKYSSIIPPKKQRYSPLDTGHGGKAKQRASLFFSQERERKKIEQEDFDNNPEYRRSVLSKLGLEGRRGKSGEEVYVLKKRK